MSAKAGDTARENAIYRCEGCNRRVPVHSGMPIGECPDCGSPSFQTGLAIQPRTADVVLNGIG